jgi:hypothetical protein
MKYQYSFNKKININKTRLTFQYKIYLILSGVAAVGSRGIFLSDGSEKKKTQRPAQQRRREQRRSGNFGGESGARHPEMARQESLDKMYNCTLDI